MPEDAEEPERVLTEELDKLEDWVQQMEQSRSSHDANASSESGASSFTTPTSGDSDATNDGELAEGDEEVIELFNGAPSQVDETREGETEASDPSLSDIKDNTEVSRGYMQHPNILIPPSAHLAAQLIRKLDLVSSSFPNIPRETLIEQLTALNRLDPIRVPGLDEVPDLSQSLEDIAQGLTDDQTSFEDFQTRLENFQTHLKENPRSRQILEAITPQTDTRYAEAQEHLNQATERLRDEHPEHVNEIEEHRAVIDGTLPSLDNVLNTLQSEVEMNAAGTPGAFEIPSAEVIIVQALYNAAQDNGTPLPREEPRDLDAGSVADNAEGVYPQSREEELRTLIQEVNNYNNKRELLDSLFPDISRSTLYREFTAEELLEGRANPDLAAILDAVPGSRQNLEAILQGLSDTEISVENFRARVEELRTLLDANPSYETALTAALNETAGEKAEIFLNQLIEAFRNRYPVISEELEEYYRAIREYIEKPREMPMPRINIETRYAEAQEHLNQATEQLRDDNPELMNEVEEYRAFIDELDGVFNPPQSEAATDAAGTTGALETPDVEVIGAQEVSNMVQTASALSGMSILARIIWRNLKHLQDFYKGVGKLRNDVEALNQKYADGEITREDYELGVDEAVRGLEELFRERVSKPLDAIYPNWASKVLGIKEENRPGEDNALSANSEPSGEELAQEFIEHIADGDFYFAAAVDYIVPSMTESQLDAFLTEIRNRVSTEAARPSAARGTANAEPSEVRGVLKVPVNGESDEVDAEAYERFNGVPSQKDETGQVETEILGGFTSVKTRDDTDPQDKHLFGKEYDEDNRIEKNGQETPPPPPEDESTDSEDDPINKQESTAREATNPQDGDDAIEDLSGS